MNRSLLLLASVVLLFQGCVGIPLTPDQIARRKQILTEASDPGLKDRIVLAYKARHRDKQDEAELANDISRKPPIAVYTPKPRYPVELRSKGVQGMVWVAFIVRKDGNPESIEILLSDHPAFSSAATTAVQSWRFKPGYSEGGAVDTRMMIPMAFTLDDPKQQ